MIFLGLGQDIAHLLCGRGDLLLVFLKSFRLFCRRHFLNPFLEGFEISLVLRSLDLFQISLLQLTGLATGFGAGSAPRAGVATSADLVDTPNGTRIQVAGMAIARQRPSTANGIVFMLLEDEHGQANLIIPPNVYEHNRAVIRGEPLLLARGKLERHDRNVNLLVAEVVSLGPLARRAASEAEVGRSLPRAHHFGHR